MLDHSDDYGKLLDKLGKLVGCFGIILGFAYIAGLSQNYFLFSELQATWVLGMIDSQTLIKDGLPWAVLCALCAFLMFIWFPDSASLRDGMSSVLPAVSVVGMIGMFILSFLGVDVNSSKGLVFFLRIVPLGASIALISWALKLYFEGAERRKIAITAVVGLAFAFGMLPYFDAAGAASSIKFGDKGLPLVVETSGKVSGVLAGVVSGKYIVFQCQSVNVSILEISPALSVRPSAGACL